MGKNRHLTMKELPRSEQPYEKCRQYGISSLSDAELLAILIRSGTQDRKATDVAMALLQMDERYPGLEGLMRLKSQDFIKIPGIGKVKALQLEALGELARRFSRSTFKEKHLFQTSEEVARYYMAFMQTLEKEELHLLLLDLKNRMIADKLISVGTVRNALMDPREVFIQALTHHAVKIILIHNHPSGDASPSMEDITVTERLIEAGKLIGIELLDHIIIGHQTFISLCSDGTLKERGTPIGREEIRP